jgi:endonuclease/exonuclease/phosphatase (EEP) superfamily protein YafD
VAVCATVAAPFGPVTVAATHLAFVPGWNVAQLRRVVRFLRRCGPAPYLLLGDLNLPPFVVGRVSGLRGLVAGRTFPAPAPRVQLDHVLSAGLRRVGAGGAVELAVSDHRALVVEVGP